MGDIGPVQQRYEVLPLGEPVSPAAPPPSRPKRRLVRLTRKTTAKA